MINTTRPVGIQTTVPVVYQPQAVATTAPQPVMVPVTAQSTGGIGKVISDIFNGIVNFFKKLFGGSTATTTPVVPTPGTTTNPAAAADDATLAAQYGLRPDAANVAAFRQVLAAQTAEAGVVGPGSTNADAVRELQTVLTQFGHPVPVTGTFDVATADAVMAWKAQVGLTESFVFANGQPGTTPFIDAKTKAKMIQLLTGAAPSTTASTPTVVAPAPVVVAPAPVAPAPVAPPPPPPPAPAPPPPAPAPPAPAPAPTPVVVTPTPTPIPPTTTTAAAASDLTADEQKIAQQAGVLATKENFLKFTAEAQKIDTSTDTIGPGLRDTKDTVNELQAVLKQFGYAVNPTGTFDQATVDAVLKFKRDNGITYDYKMADGSAGVHPFIDARTKDAMIKKLTNK